MMTLHRFAAFLPKRCDVFGDSLVLSAGFAAKARVKRRQQAELLPFTKALSAFHDRVLSADAQPNAAAEDINTKSFDKLLSFVKRLAKATNAYPPAMAESVTFMVRNQHSGKPRTVSTLLRTTGGDCSQSVGKSMAQLFTGAGSPSLFYWDKGMWQLSKSPADLDTVQDARSKAAAAGVPSSEPMTLQELEAVQLKMAAKLKQAKAFTSGEQFLGLAQPDTQQPLDSRVPGEQEQEAVSSGAAEQEVQAAGPEGDSNSPAHEQTTPKADDELAAVKSQIRKLEPLLAALAAVPWIDPGADDGQRVPYIKTTVLDQVEGMGWDVRGGVTRMWSGDQDLDHLIAEKDPGSQIALQTIRAFGKKYEADFGKRPSGTEI